MFQCSGIVYEYDGTLDGFFCCVFESFAKKETPLDIRSAGAVQLTLEPVQRIETAVDKAARVRQAIPKKISPDAMRLIENVFLTFLEQKEFHMLNFLQLGFTVGRDVMRDLTNDTVSILFKAQKHLLNESHRYKQFVRFSATEKVLVSVIKPLNQVLPMIAPHFIDRYPEECFLIYDTAHGMALVSKPGQSAIVPVDSFVMGAHGEEEQMYRELWCEYYDTIAIEQRYNPKCRRNHMPKRYWDEMTEFCRENRPELRKAGRYMSQSELEHVDKFERQGLAAQLAKNARPHIL